ncbi:hypothetical protein M413DRAFT_191517 [Hebeloma cylindrosporum]|uniref:Uncharacterized protein n=1 Tax=Hebeloma cylindrosporum TaxID=76867 RepID=A0A0C3BRX7_HEBCY|nr:hypothetical protein M413DRAFT_191517 [Hebeloma cylindrosporum h7]
MDSFQKSLAVKENLQLGADIKSASPYFQPSAVALPPSLASQPSNDGLLNMAKVLQLRLEQHEAQWKKDAKEIEAQRKKDAEEIESQRKKDVEEIEARRKRDAEEIEARWKKDCEEIEARWKKDCEEAEARWKEDQEDRMEPLSDLQLRIREMNLDVERFRQERIEKDKATQRRLDSLAHDLEAISDFLSWGDDAGLDRIKRINLLHHARASLATHLALVPADNPSFASAQFQEALGRSSSTQERQQRLFEVWAACPEKGRATF